MYYIYYNKKPKFIDYLFKHSGVKTFYPYSNEFNYDPYDYNITYAYEYQPVKAKVKYDVAHGYMVYAVYNNQEEYIGGIEVMDQSFDFDNKKYEIVTSGGKAYKIIEKEIDGETIESYVTTSTPYQMYLRESYI